MLDAQVLVLDLIRCLRPLVERMRATCPDLAGQVVRAATSVGLNLAEGIRRKGADKRRVYRLAAAEAQEVKAALEIAAAWAALDDADLVDARALADRVGRITYALAR